MKRSNKRILAALLLFLILFTGIFQNVVAAPVSGTQVVSGIGGTHDILPGSKKASSKKTTQTVASTASNNGAYGTQLTGLAKTFYNKLKSTNLRKKKMTINLGKKYVFSCSSSAAKKGSYFRSSVYLNLEKKLTSALEQAFDAFKKDVPSTYWMHGYKWYTYVKWSSRGKTATCYITKITLSPTKYYSKILKEDSSVNSVLKSMVSTINRTRPATDRYNTVKTIHDLIICSMDYGHEYPFYGYEHTITGGLLSKYKHLVVCEGYSKLFKNLCDRFQIPCVIVESATHSWNYVKMSNNCWYLVDCTWDDLGGSKISYNYFLKGKNTLDVDHIPQTTVKARYNYYSIAYNLLPPTLASSAYQ